MKERYNDGQCVVEGLAGEELRQIVASPDTGEAGDTSQVTTQHCPPSSKRLTSRLFLHCGLHQVHRRVEFRTQPYVLLNALEQLGYRCQ